MKRSSLYMVSGYTQYRHLDTSTKVTRGWDCPVQLPTEQRSGREHLLQHPVAVGLSSREMTALLPKKNKVPGPRQLNPVSGSK